MVSSLDKILGPSIQKDIQDFIQKIKNKEITGNDFTNLVSKLSTLFFSRQLNIYNSQLITLYKDIFNLEINDYAEIQNEISKQINTYQTENKDYLIYILFLRTINYFSNKYTYKFSDEANESSDNFFVLRKLPNIGDFNALFKLCYDEECHFYIQKNYNNINEELIKKEVEIYHTDFKNEYPSFIVHSKDEMKLKKITFPYLPFQTLKLFLDQIHQKQSKIRFTAVDKFVIMKEIAIGFTQLHSKSTYHQNINSSSIMIDNNKNSFFCNFSHDLNLEPNQTKLVPSFYYRHPDLIDKPTNLSKDEELKDSEIQILKKHDIYSYGVLMHEIITTISPEDRFGNKARSERFDIVSKGYKEFLFSEYEEEDFDSKYELQGIRRIIEKCLSTNEKNSYPSFKEIISELDQLQIYQKNKEEIDYRINNTTKIKTYECSMCNLVINYFLGNDFSKEIIQTLIDKFQLDEESQIIKNDVIFSHIFGYLNYKNDTSETDNFPFIYEEEFNSIIRENLNQSIKLDYFKFNINQRKLITLSLLANDNKLKYSTFNEILSTQTINDVNSMSLSTSSLTTATKCLTNLIPITTLDKFMNEFEEEIKENLPIFLYFISKEISIIHSYRLYHGEIQTNSIGIYYNTETDTFIPLIIPFYFFFKGTQTETTNELQNENETINQYQQKDIKHFIKIIKNLDKTRIIPNDILKTKSINSIVTRLYNFNLSNLNQNIRTIFTQNYNNFEYSFYDITYTEINKIFNSMDKNAKTYKIMDCFFIAKNEESFLKLDGTIHNIYNFFYINKCNQPDILMPNMTRKERIEEMLISIKESNDNSLIEYQDKIFTDKENDSKIVILNEKDKILIQKMPEEIKEEKEIKKYENEIHFKSYMRYKLDFSKSKIRKIDHKVVYRCIDLYIDLTYKSFEFLFKRYIKSLHPRINYKVSVRFIQSDNTNVYHNDVLNIGRKMGLNGVNINGNIVFKIKRSISY